MRSGRRGPRTNPSWADAGQIALWTRVEKLDAGPPGKGTRYRYHLDLPGTNVTLEVEQDVYQKARKCAHIPCLCEVADGEKYCGNACRDAGSEDVEIACQCDHPPCPLVA